MGQFAAEFLSGLGRTTLWLVLAAIVALLLLRMMRVSSPSLHRAAWVIALAVGWSFLRLSVAVPWYEAPPTESRAPVSAVTELVEPAEDRPARLEPAAMQSPALNAPVSQRAMQAKNELSPRRLDWPLVAIGIWALGIVVLVTNWLCGYVRLVRRLQGCPAAEGGWQEQWRGLLSSRGVLRPIPLRITPDLGPMLCRLPRRCELLVPAELWRELSAPQRAAILQHELAHWQRGDVWKSLAVRVLALLHWFNPASWLAVRRFEEAAEWACDQAATLEAPATEYAKVLLQLATSNPAYGATARGRTLARRIRRLLAPRHEEDAQMKKIVLILAGLCLAALPLVRLQLVAKQPPAVVADSSAAQSDMLLKKKVRIVDAAGRPVAGATVVPWAIRTARAHGAWSVNGFGASEPPTLRTDAEGEVTIRFPRFAKEAEKIPTKDLTCRVDHPEYAATSYKDVPVTDTERDTVATIVLQRGAHVEVAARADGRLLPMDHVYALWSSPHAGQKTVKVNMAGRLQLPHLPAGMELLRLAYFPVEGPAMFSEVEQLELVDDEQYDLQVEMKPAVSVKGRLDSDVPRPVKNGRVVAEVIQRPTRGHALEWRAWATIKEDGSFSLDALPRGNLQVIALCDGFMAESGAPPDFVSEQERTFTSGYIRPQVFSVTEEENEITLKMTPTADCLIHVLGPDDRPMGSAKCGFWPNVGWWGGGSQVYCHPLYSTFEGLTDPQRVKDHFANDRLFTANTDADGKAVIKNLPPGASGFAVLHSDFELAMDDNKQRYGHVDLKVGEQNEVTVKLQPKGTQFIGE